MRIALNLATRPFADQGPAIKRLRIGICVLAALCIGFLIGLHFFDAQAAAARAQEHSLDGQLAHIQAERQHADNIMHEPANAELLDQAQFLNQLFDDKAFSWTLAMEAMETVLPAGVQVTAIEPTRDKEGHIIVHLRVTGARDRSVDLVRNLEHSRRFLAPRIVGESAEASNGPNQRPEPVSASNRFDFDLLAEYNPPVPGERFGAHRANAAANVTTLSSLAPRSPAASPATMSREGSIPGQRRRPYTGPAPANPTYLRNPNRASGGPQ
jgi:type IV pilus assembly protein PilN